jgi:hypothetical protein
MLLSYFKNIKQLLLHTHTPIGSKATNVLIVKEIPNNSQGIYEKNTYE